MIKRSLLPIALIIMVSMLAGCGGTGSSSEPAGVNPAVPSIVQLLAVQQIAQTNSTIILKAKVLDGNGNVIPGVPVAFTNLSLLGVLGSTTAKTDSLGYASVSLYSTDTGFATIQAEVNSGSGMVRDKKTVFFSIFDLFLSTGAALPELTLEVDSNNNGIYNEPSDFLLTSGGAIIKATVLDSSKAPAFGDLVIFGSDSTELTFPDGDTKLTNSDGEAFARIMVDLSEIRNFNTPVNVSAVSSLTGAFNILTLFVTPIQVGQLLVAADPTTVDSGGSSQISALVQTTAGTAVPDGTTVNFSATAGSVVPFSQTTNGLATAQFTAPTLAAGAGNQTVAITASSGGKSASTSVTVLAPQKTLTITPASATVATGATPTTFTFNISGGTGPYTTTSSDPFRVYNGTAGNGSWNTAGVTVTIAANACPGTVTLTTFDSAGESVTATLTITSATIPLLSVTPLSVSCLGGGACTPNAVTVMGGSLPYTVASSNPAVVPSPVPPTVSGGAFSVTAPNPVSTQTIVTLSVGDACGQTTAVTVTVN